MMEGEGRDLMGEGLVMCIGDANLGKTVHIASIHPHCISDHDFLQSHRRQKRYGCQNPLLVMISMGSEWLFEVVCDEHVKLARWGISSPSPSPRACRLDPKGFCRTSLLSVCSAHSSLTDVTNLSMSFVHPVITAIVLTSAGFSQK